MLISDIAFAQFTSKALSAGVVNVMLGFVPSFAILISDQGGTNPNIYLWANHDDLSLWDAAQSILDTGSSGILTQDTTGITVYAGGDTISTVSAANDDPKYVNANGDLVGAGQGGADGSVPFITQAGLAIPADHQTASGKNTIIAFRGNR